MTQSQLTEVIFSERPSRKTVHFEEIITHPVSTTTSMSLLTSPSSTSLNLPLIAEKPGVRFQMIILFLTLFIALIIGIILSLVLVTQLINVPARKVASRPYPPMMTELTSMERNFRLYEQLPKQWTHHFDFTTDVCNDFYHFVCRKWLMNHPLMPMELKRSWFTEKSREIRMTFEQFLANMSENEAYNYQMDRIQNNETEGTNSDDAVSLLSVKNELEQFYSFHPVSDEESHQRVKRQSFPPSVDLPTSMSNMLLNYQQCRQTSSSMLVDQTKQLISDRFWFLNSEQLFTSYPYLFEQMLEHPLMRVWNMNTIHLGTQTIIHIQRQIQDQDELLLRQHHIEQANLFEEFLQENQIDLCPLSSRVGTLNQSLKEYNELLISFLSRSNVSISDDLQYLLSDENSLPIVHSSVRRPNDLRDFIQLMFDKNILLGLNRTDIEELCSNFTIDLDRHLLHVPIFRSTISHQCQLFLHYYLQFRSLNETKIQPWLDYIVSSIIHLIVHSWPGDASYTCLYTTIVRHQQLEMISNWKSFLQYARSGTNDFSSPMISVEIRLVDFFQLDSIFRFLFADRLANFCHLMVYKYGPKLVPFLGVFHEKMQITLKTLWKQTLQETSNEQRNMDVSLSSFNRIPTDCLALLEQYYPYTLSTFYDHSMLKKTTQLYSIAYELRDHLLNNTFDSPSFSSLQFHIQSERLKLHEDFSSNSSLVQVPYEYYSLEDTFLSTAWNMIDNVRDDLFHLTHQLFEINGYHTIEQGIFLQPTVAELYSNESTKLIALLLIAHELGHAYCPCAYNLTEREYLADSIALPLIINYQETQLNRSLTSEELKHFFLVYGQSECLQIDRPMSLLINNEQNSIDIHINRLLKDNAQFRMEFNCSTNGYDQIKRLRHLLSELCATCRQKQTTH